MQKKRSGRIIFNASTNGSKTGEYVITYRASNAALIMVTRSLALFAAPFGITVNAICPGVTMTPLHRKLMEKVMINGGVTFDEYMEERVKRIPMGRFTDVKDIADITEFLLSDNGGSLPARSHT